MNEGALSRIRNARAELAAAALSPRLRDIDRNHGDPAATEQVPVESRSYTVAAIEYHAERAA